ncbi:hypothetical DNA-binding protein [Pelotomaculum thermopropionicum SI]|uniref:Hypothetical DNA-binding protein n=1 Tax=Pelotomaculum thermopropionicum (strain DSM 13744 / JCM 10971 / SI) TaxID=370438 RepID=A5CZG4_PELTS|nr:hypothetical DNA-binding protein [Pelotomaculum thermopropionicum SI]
MPRPKKQPGEKRDRRLTVYLTEKEEDRLNMIAGHLGIDKAKFVVKAINNEIARLENPPAQLAQARYEDIIKKDVEYLSGYVCSNGHAFWLDDAWPSPPERCPCCGERSIKRTWAGIVRRGF